SDTIRFHAIFSGRQAGAVWFLARRRRRGARRFPVALARFALAGISRRGCGRDAARDHRCALLHETRLEYVARRGRRHREPHRSRLQREHRHDQSAGVDVARRRLQPPRQCAARGTPVAVSARVAARHRHSSDAALDGADQCERACCLQQRRRASDFSRRPQARRPCVRRADRRVTRAVAAGRCLRGRLTVHDRRRRRVRDLPSLAAGLPAQQSVASPLSAEADDARAGAAGSRDLEEGDPRDRARAQQLARADFFAGAFGPPDGRASGCLATGADLPHDRRARAASAYVHRWLRALREAAAAAAGTDRLARLPALVAGNGAVHACRRAADAPRRVRPGADRADDHQPGEEREGGGRAAGQHRVERAGACRGLAVAGAGSRRRYVRGSPAQRAAAVLFDKTCRRRPRPDTLPRGHRGTWRPDFAGKPPRRRVGGDFVDSRDRAGVERDDVKRPSAGGARTWGALGWPIAGAAVGDGRRMNKESALANLGLSGNEDTATVARVYGERLSAIQDQLVKAQTDAERGDYSTKLSQLVESYEFVTQTGRHTKAAANESSATVMRTGTEIAQMAPQMDTLIRMEPGAVLSSRLEIGALLGQGGMGNVYAARDRLKDEDVAIKVLRQDLLFSTAAKERF